jgi:hypothetical protein
MSDSLKQRPKKVMPISPGRPKGKPNRVTGLLKDAILKAAEQAGNDIGNDGLVSYLQHQAVENPGPFMTLLSRVLPLQMTGIDDEPIKHSIRVTIVDPKQ